MKNFQTYLSHEGRAAKYNGQHTCFQTQLPQVQFVAYQIFFQRKKLSILLRLINSAGLGKKDSGLKS